VHWLETGNPDPAQELANIVLNSAGESLPTRAHVLARLILDGTTTSAQPPSSPTS